MYIHIVKYSLLQSNDEVFSSLHVVNPSSKLTKPKPFFKKKSVLWVGIKLKTIHLSSRNYFKK